MTSETHRLLPFMALQSTRFVAMVMNMHVIAISATALTVILNMTMDFMAVDRTIHENQVQKSI